MSDITFSEFVEIHNEDVKNYFPSDFSLNPNTSKR
jgi:hypothetical protein